MHRYLAHGCQSKPQRRALRCRSCSQVPGAGRRDVMRKARGGGDGLEGEWENHAVRYVLNAFNESFFLDHTYPTLTTLRTLGWKREIGKSWR